MILSKGLVTELQFPPAFLGGGVPIMEYVSEVSLHTTEFSTFLKILLGGQAGEQEREGEISRLPAERGAQRRTQCQDPEIMT